MSTPSSPTIDRAIEAYDLQAEKQRYQYEDVTLVGLTINRGTTRIQVNDQTDKPAFEAIRKAHHDVIFTTTHDDGAPVLELGYPNVGSFVGCSAGVYMDCMLGVAQKILCEQHPYYTRSIEAQLKHKLLLRREINTDDYLVCAEGVEGIHTPQELADLLGQMATEAYGGSHRVFLSNSGAEAVEAAIKLASLATYRKLIAAYGADTFARLCQDLGIGRNTNLDDVDSSDEPIYRDYPFFMFAYKGAFHGRTHGALSLTQSKKAHQIGYFKSRWVHHLTFNGDPSELANMIDDRPLTEILDSEGGVRAVIEAGRVPRDLAAAVIAEGYQGEGGYVPGNTEYFKAVRKICDEHAIYLVADEVQTFARTGNAFMYQTLGVRPDITTVAKGAAVGATIASAEMEQYLQAGWHSNTWGGGKLFDIQMAYATLDALVNYKEPAFDGLSYWENQRVKGQFLHHQLEQLKVKHPNLVSFSGHGCMHGIEVTDRDKVCQIGWSHGLKLLGCGPGGETGMIRLLFLADVTTHEIEEFARVLDEVLAVAR